MHKGPVVIPTVTRFMEKVEQTDSCWIWRGWINGRNGHGQFNMCDGRTIGAQRASHELFIGPIPEGLIVYRSCGDKLCVNPKHLFVGTYRDNLLDPKERFLAKVNKTKTCWLWTGHIHKNTGYGCFGFNGENIGAHRVSYELFVGPITDGLYVLHHCDVKNCIRPSHLFLGTAEDNSRDAASKGRLATGERSGSYLYPERISRGLLNYYKNNPERKLFGERNNNAKLTQAKVDVIRARASNGEQLKIIAADMGVSPATIASIIHERRWKPIKLPEAQK